MIDTNALVAYGQTLVAEGFEVWHTGSGFRDAGWLTYRNPANDCWGTLQYSLSEARWQHLMPITPSKEYGSSMHVEVKPTSSDPRTGTMPAFTVEAARQCASPSNWNRGVGKRANAGKAYLSPSAVRLGE